MIEERIHVLVHVMSSVRLFIPLNFGTEINVPSKHIADNPRVIDVISHKRVILINLEHDNAVGSALPSGARVPQFNPWDNIATDKRGYQHNIFLISPRKHMLWVLIRSASLRHF